MALVVDGADSEPRLREEDGSELDHPAGLSCETVNDGDHADRLGRGQRGPPLSEKPETAGVSDELGRVTHRVTGVELICRKRAKGALVVGLRHWMQRHCLALKCGRPVEDATPNNQTHEKRKRECVRMSFCLSAQDGGEVLMVVVL